MGDKIHCPNCNEITYLPYNATLRRKAAPRQYTPQSPKPFVNQNNSQANNAEGGSKIGIIVFAIVGYLVFLFISLAVFDDSFFRQFLIYGGGGILIGLINSISRSDK